jgi:acetyltransferase-like isoleucine patch superfamily enzyme
MMASGGGATGGGDGPIPKPEKGGKRPVGNLRFIIKNRLYMPLYWLLAFRFIKFKLFHPGIKTEGMIFLPGKYDISKGRGAELTIGKWVWIGKGCAFRAHEGSLRIGRKTTFGGNNTINCYNRVEIGEECLFADDIYVVDFDHWWIDPHKSIRSQGIWKDKVIIESGVWVGQKASILAGVTVGEGAAIGAMTLVTRDVPPFAIAVGIPARILKYRRSPMDVAWDNGETGG